MVYLLGHKRSINIHKIRGTLPHRRGLTKRRRDGYLCVGRTRQRAKFIQQVNKDGGAAELGASRGPGNLLRRPK